MSKEHKFNTKIAHLVSIQTTRTKVIIGVFEDHGDAIQFAHENGENVVVEDVNWFPKRRQRFKNPLLAGSPVSKQHLEDKE